MTKKTKRNVIISASSTIAVCLGLIAGGTYAWFTDKADVSVNKVVSGTLDVTMKMRNNPDEEWVDAEGQTLHFLRAATTETGGYGKRRSRFVGTGRNVQTASIADRESGLSGVSV